MAVGPNVEEAERDYRKCGMKMALHTIPKISNVGGKVSGRKMVTLYTGTFSRKRSKARRIYDEIRASAAGGICPLCGQREVKTLDHYLEKQHHPVFAVTPLNLVPACTDCNKVRSEFPKDGDSNQTLHPYFDSVDDERWLKAKVDEVDPVIVPFHEDPPLC
jgi:hypothetical protein